MSLKEMLVARFGPLMTYSDMAALFGLGGAVAADAMRQRMRRDRLLGTQLRACAVRLGRRTYFRADLVAAAIGELTSVSGPRVQGIGARAGSDSRVSDAVVSPPGNAKEGGGMTALFEMPLPSETLSAEEIQQITGCGRRADQVAWLDAQGWAYVKNRAGDPVVGRLYARLRLAGITPSVIFASGGWSPDFSVVR